MKKSISVSNLTLDLWLKYVRPAARAAGILEEVPARDDWHEYTAEVTEEAAAEEIAHCMYCACMNSHIGNGDYTEEGEVRQMLYQLEVSMKYDLRHTAETITALYNALSAMLNPETTGENKEEETMLKTNSKKARENVRAYILNNFTPENYTNNPPQDFPGVAAFILDTFRSEKPAVGGYARMTESERFTDWASGLPSVLDTCYYYNRSAVDDLGAILEETESEKARFDEPQAESLLTNLIYRELVRGCK